MGIESFRCHNCSKCLGTGCIDELPGMGGVNKNENFILNCSAWKKLYDEEGAAKVPVLPKEKILSLSPKFYEILPLTLEEVFISEMEEIGYDFTEILDKKR